MKPLINKSLEALIEKFELKAKSGEIIDLRHYYDALTMDVIARCAFGINIDTIRNPDNPIYAMTKKMFETDFTISRLLIFLFPKLGHYLDLSFIDLESQRFIANSIKQVIEERLRNHVNSVDLLQLTLESSELSDKRENSRDSFESKSKNNSHSCQYFHT